MYRALNYFLASFFALTFLLIPASSSARDGHEGRGGGGRIGGGMMGGQHMGGSRMMGGQHMGGRMMERDFGRSNRMGRDFGRIGDRNFGVRGWDGRSWDRDWGNRGWRGNWWDRGYGYYNAYPDLYIDPFLYTTPGYPNYNYYYSYPNDYYSYPSDYYNDYYIPDYYYYGNRPGLSAGFSSDNVSGGIIF